MARNLFRFYLYTVFIAMLIFATVGLGRLLQTLLALTPLRGAYGARPLNSDIVQAVVFFLISLVISSLLGGLHYWLIRRDMHSDPAAGQSAIRAFFLNIAELIIAPLVVSIAASFFINELGRTPALDVTGAAAFAIAALVLYAVLEGERQRTQAGPGAAMAFQRLHLYGVQLILLIILAFFWISTARQLLDAFVFGGQATGTPLCGGFTGCQGPNLLSSVTATLLVVLFWIGYGYFARNDTSSMLRRILHYTSFAYGVGLVLYGIWQAITLGLLTLFGVTVHASEVVGSYDFTSFITLGLLVIAVYGTWLRIAAGQTPAERLATIQIGESIITALFAAAFWWGVAYILLDVFEGIAHTQLGPRDWAPALALLITGLAYIPLDLYLRRRYKQHTSTALEPRRGLIFALIGGGILAVAIGGAVALYSLGTNLLGSPFDNWPHVARTGTSAFIVGVLILAIYFWTARREHLFGGLLKRPAPSVAPSAAEPGPAAKPSTIEDILDELLAGKITREEAATRIRSVTSREPSHA
jgi:hypothetical protein